MNHSRINAFYGQCEMIRQIQTKEKNVHQTRIRKSQVKKYSNLCSLCTILHKIIFAKQLILQICCFKIGLTVEPKPGECISYKRQLIALSMFGIYINQILDIWIFHLVHKYMDIEEYN